MSNMFELRANFYHPFDYSYLNRTTSSYLEILNTMPGVSRIRLSDDVQQNTEAILIYTPFVFMGASRELFQSMMERLRAHYDVPLKDINFDNAQRYFERFSFAHERSTAAVALMTEYDLHAIRAVDPIVSYSTLHKDYWLTAGPELYDLELHHLDPQTDLDPTAASAGYAYLAGRNDRIISMYHTLADSEILNEQIIRAVRKSRRISVPGIGYAARNTTASLIAGLSKYDWIQTALDRAVYAAGRQLPWPRARQHILWSYFRHSISSSRMAMTCGSTSGYFVRKFLEIPALGSCLCTFNYSFLPQLGFKPNSEYLPIDSPTDIEEYFYRLQEPDFVESVTAYTLSAASIITQLHSLSARRIQLTETLTRIARSEFQGSYWAEGNYCFR